MKIRGEQTDLFCYHFSRVPFCKASDEALDIYCQIISRALSCERDHLIEANCIKLNEPIKMTEEPPLGILGWDEQVAAINACLLATFQPGYQPENFILEQTIHVALRADIMMALEFLDKEDERLISWSRVFAIIEGEDGLKIPTYDDIDCIIECITWDDDWAAWQLTPESIHETREKLKIYRDYPAMNCIPKYNFDFWDQYQWSDSQINQLGLPDGFCFVANKKTTRFNKVAERKGEGFVYCIRECGGHVKIGKTIKDPYKRLRALQTSNPKILELCFAIRHKQYSDIENKMHELLKSYRVAGEWFNCDTERVRGHFEKVKDAEWIEGVAA